MAATKGRGRGRKRETGAESKLQEKLSNKVYHRELALLHGEAGQAVDLGGRNEDIS